MSHDRKITVMDFATVTKIWNMQITMGICSSHLGQYIINIIHLKVTLTRLEIELKTASYFFLAHNLEKFYFQIAINTVLTIFSSYKFRSINSSLVLCFHMWFTIRYICVHDDVVTDLCFDTKWFVCVSSYRGICKMSKNISYLVICVMYIFCSSASV